MALFFVCLPIFIVLSSSIIDLRATWFLTFYLFLPLWLYGETCTNFVIKSKRFEQMSSAWSQMIALLKLFKTVTDFPLFLLMICTGCIQLKMLKFQKRKLKIFILKFKVNLFTLSAVKSKRIELQNSAWWHLIAFLQSFLMVTNFHMFSWIICSEYRKTWRTLNLTKIVIKSHKVVFHDKILNFKCHSSTAKGGWNGSNDAYKSWMGALNC